MKRALLLAAAATAAAIAWYQAGAVPRPLAQLFPGGALVYLEAKDFSRLLTEWNSSGVKPDWLAGADYAGFERSNLFMKLNGFYKSYSAAAGFEPDMATLLSLAGDESAVALYDLKTVQFAYITRLPETKVAQTKLWPGRRSFETRQAAGVTFYVSTAQDSTVAFAATGGYLLVSTDEGRMAGMLSLVAGRDMPNIAAQNWYKQSTDAAGAPGELRLAMDLDDLVANSYFRSYWIQRNTTDVRRFLSGVADIRRTSGEIQEQRVFLKRPGLAEELPTEEATRAAGTLAALAPNDAGLYRVWAGPRASDVAELLDSHILNPRAASDAEPRYAPQEDQAASAASEADLETRIDQPPLPKPGNGPDGGTKLLTGQEILAALQVQSSKASTSGTFVALPCAIAVTARAPWDASHIEDAIGGAWTTQTHGGRTIYRMDGLASLEFAIEGQLLIVANDLDLLQAMLDRPAAAGTLNASYRAAFRHGRERANYVRLTTALDFLQGQPSQQPPFFSGNIASLSYALRRVNGVEISERATADRVEQRVVYTLLQLR